MTKLKNPFKNKNEARTEVRSTCGPYTMGEIDKPCCSSCPGCKCHECLACKLEAKGGNEHFDIHIDIHTCKRTEECCKLNKCPCVGGNYPFRCICHKDESIYLESFMNVSAKCNCTNDSLDCEKCFPKLVRESLTPKEVVMAAFHYLADVAPPTQKISDVRIEEVQSKEEGGATFWKIVLSYDNVGEFPFDKKREYKEFKVDDTDARVISMKKADAKE